MEEIIVEYSQPSLKETLERTSEFVERLRAEGIITSNEADEWKQNLRNDYDRGGMGKID